MDRYSKPPDGDPVRHIWCSPCGKEYPRNFEADMKSVRQVGSTPIEKSDSKFSLSKELSFAFGKYKQNPDGSVDKNHPPFANTKELDAYMAGKNNLGPPRLDQKTGLPITRPDGSHPREGAEMFKYDANATPSRDTVRKKPRRSGLNVGRVSGASTPPVLSSGFVSQRDAGGDGPSNGAAYGPLKGARQYSSPRRKKRR